MTYKFCPNCGFELNGSFKFCPECGCLFERTAFEGLDGQNTPFSAQTEKKLRTANALIIRGRYSEAKAVYEEILNEEPYDVRCYVGLVRAETYDYTYFDDYRIDKAVAVAEKMAKLDTVNKVDGAYISYIEKREAYFAEKKRKEEEARIAEEKRRAEAELKRKAEELKREAEAKRMEEERLRREAEEKRKAEQWREKYAAAEEKAKTTGFVIIDDALFKYCGTSADVSVPHGVTKINPYAFYGNRDVKKVVLPSGVTEIGDNAFCGCEKLENITVPQSLAYIGDMAFAHCYRLRTVKLPQNTLYALHAFNYNGGDIFAENYTKIIRD